MTQSVPRLIPSSHPYRGRRCVLTTMHGKGEVIAPPFLDRLGLVVETATGVNTDALGTFSGEIARVGAMGEVAIRKARLGMAQTGLTLGLASEGSFGPHPHFPFLTAGVEILALVDDERAMTITESLIADQTNSAEARANSVAMLGAFLERALYPSHALIVKANQPSTLAQFDQTIFKGIVRDEELARAVRDCAAASGDGLALVQTDMRAHLNPTRMASLAALAHRLAARLERLCPCCGAPGWGVMRLERGLPCRACGTATELVSAEVFGCGACGAQEVRRPPDHPKAAEPIDCPQCNP